MTEVCAAAPDATAPRAVPAGDTLSVLEALLIDLGLMMLSSDDIVSRTTARLHRIADVYGAKDAHVIVLPTGLWIQVADGAPVHLAERPLRGTGLRLDQISSLYKLADTLERGGMDLAAATEALRRITAVKPRFPIWVNVLGHTLLVLGLTLVFQPTLIALLSALVAGTFVGLLRLVNRTSETFGAVLPVLAAFLVTLGAFTLIDFTPEARPLRLLIPPLVTFLPGAALTLSVVELAYGDITSGASRLIAGILQVALLYFGIAAAVQLLGVPSAQIGQSLALNQIGWFAPPFGVAIFGLGVFLFFSAPRGTLPWLLLSLYTAWFGQQIGTALFGAELGGFVGGLAMALVVLVSERLGGPPAFVAFLPAFWLLVPGATALISLTELASGSRDVGSAPIIDTAIAITAIALGVLVGAAIYRGLARLAPVAR
jgi:uncharacterized membrane protein YjjP (DUF1212 family)/uncharacterized membrane protein YjjB (DUF3815 family)